MFLTALLLIDNAKPIFLACVVSATSVPFFLANVLYRCYAFATASSRQRCALAAVDDAMYSVYQKFLLFFFENVSGAQLVTYSYDGDALVGRGEKAIYICNHQSSLDWAIMDMLAVRQSQLGSLRYVLKDALMYIPLYGWYFYAHGGVYVKRGGGFNSSMAVRQLDFLKQLEVPTSLIIFPEGTRFQHDKTAEIQLCHAFAKQAGLYVPKRTLLPRVNGFHLLVNNLANTFDAIYDVTIVYECQNVDDPLERTKAPPLMEFMLGKRNYTVHVKLDRIPMHCVPKEMEQLRLWLYGRFAHKDEWLLSFESGQSTLSNGMHIVQQDRLSFYETAPSAFLLVGLTVSMLSFKLGRMIYLGTFIAGTIVSLASMKIRAVA